MWLSASESVSDEIECGCERLRKGETGGTEAAAQIVRKDERTAEKRNKRLNGMNGKGTRKGKKRINLKKYFNNMFCLSHTQTHTHAQAQTHQNQSKIEQMRNENAVTYNKMNHFCRSNEKKTLL